MKSRALRWAEPWLSLAAPRGPKRISAMVRVRNEEDFLAAALESIVDQIDQIVVIDNLSEDRTPQIARQFEERFPAKVKLLEYRHRIARPGAESSSIANSRAGRRSPSSLAVFYDWCVAACDNPYVLKWDGDMVACDDFAGSISEFRARSEVHALWFSGINAHPDLAHSLANSSSTQTFVDYEARVFPKRFATHNLEPGIYESLRTPYKHGRFALYWPVPTYLHLKWCKRAPLDNWSRGSSADSPPLGWPRGDRLPSAMGESIRRFGLTSLYGAETSDRSNEDEAGDGVG